MIDERIGNKDDAVRLIDELVGLIENTSESLEDLACGLRSLKDAIEREIV
jgi:hypothetical protein